MEQTLTPVPLGERVIVEPIVQLEETSDIYTPEQNLPKPNQGIIVAVSDEVKNLSVGTLVQFNEGYGTPLIMGDKGYLLMRLGDIICKFVE